MSVNLSFEIGLLDLNIDSTGGSLSTLNNIETLLGGSADDNFAFADGAVLAGGGAGTFINGGSGNNTLDYSAYTTATYINLGEFIATGLNDELAGGFVNIQNVAGGSGGNYIYGDDGDNVLISTSGNDHLYGLGGDDTYIFRDGSGIDVVYEDIDGGYDTLIFESSTRGVVFTFYSDRVEVVGGTDSVTHYGGNVEAFVGTDLDDRFVLEAGVSLTHAKLDGGLGHDEIDFSASTTTRKVTLTGVGSQDGFQGSELAVGGFDNVDKLIGSGLNGDSLTGINADATWQLGAGESYTSTNKLDFSGFELLTGGSADDCFEIADGATFAGTLNGGAGHDTFDLSSLSGDTSTVLNGKGLVDGFSGTSSAFAGSFTNIDEVLAGSGTADSLNGLNENATWHLGSIYTYESTHTLDFSGFESLLGGSAVDFFSIEGAGSFAGTVNGGAGSDRISYAAYGSGAQIDLGAGTASGLGGYSSIEGVLGSAYNDTLTGTGGDDTFRITSNAAGSVNGSFSFSSFELLAGGSGWNILDFSAYGSAVTVDIESGTATGVTHFSIFNEFVGSSSAADQLHGSAAGSTFTINGLNSGALDSLAFSSFENLFGSDGNDTFAFVNSGAISGLVDGGLGDNELDYSAYTAGAVSVNLNTFKATAIGGTFANIAVFIGSASADSLTASDGDNTILVNGADSGTLDGLFSFSSFENLLAGGGDDTIAFSGDGSLSGSLNGGSGTDTLDFSAYGRGVAVNLNTGTADVLGGTLSGIENLVGSDFADDLTGGSGANRIEGRAGDDSLSGLGGDDIYIFRDGSGVDVVYEDIEGGTDSLVFESSTRGVEFTFYTDRVEVIGGTDKVTHSGGNVEVFLGTDLDDRFVLKAAAGLSGTRLDGGLGSDSLDYSGYGSIRQVTLSGPGQPGRLPGHGSGGGQL